MIFINHTDIPFMSDDELNGLLASDIDDGTADAIYNEMYERDLEASLPGPEDI